MLSELKMLLADDDKLAVALSNVNPRKPKNVTFLKHLIEDEAKRVLQSP